MIRSTKKGILLDILLDHANYDELLAVLQTLKSLVTKYGKKIYSKEFKETVAKEHHFLAVVLEIFAQKDPTTHILPYITLLQSKGNRKIVEKNDEHVSLLYRDGDAVYKRSLGRDLEKLLAKK